MAETGKKLEKNSKQELLPFIQECIQSGEQYRDTFKDTWDEVEDQIRCVPPSSWNQKEDWQSKIFIPLQAKTEEIVTSYLNKMVFGKRRFFDITGVEKDDHEEAQQLAQLIDTLFEIGDFRKENNFILDEAVGNPGTSFCKVTMRNDGFLNFLWRSAYTTLIDPQCGHRFDKSRFWIDVYKKDIAYIINSTKKGKLYESGKEEVNRFLEETKDEADKIKDQAGRGTGSTSDALITVKGIDGTADITIPQKYQQVDVHECWVKVPNDKGEYEDRIVTVLNERYVLRNEENKIGCIPVSACRTKPRKYDFYGKGYLENCRGLQDLSNSMVNLGFDSLKISSMDIIFLDESKVKDPASIKYKPLAIWKLKNIDAAKITRQPMSAISDIIRGLQLVDQIHQEASGAMRQLQSAPELGGEAGDSGSTLGEYQMKMQMLDQRFLDQGRFIEKDYVIPLIKLVFKIIMNPELFNQDKVNKLLGFKEIDDLQEVPQTDPMTGETTMGLQVVGKVKVVRLDLEKVRAKGEMAYNFKAVGITQFSEKMETLAKLKEALNAALSNPTLTAMTKIDLLWKKLWQVSDIEDYDEFLRTKEEVEGLLAQQQPQQPMGMPGQGMPQQTAQGGM